MSVQSDFWLAYIWKLLDKLSVGWQQVLGESFDSTRWRFAQS